MLLGNNGTGIRAFNHAVKRDAGFGFAIDQYPVQRGATTVFRQQRAVQIKCALRGKAEDLITQ